MDARTVAGKVGGVVSIDVETLERAEQESARNGLPFPRPLADLLEVGRRAVALLAAQQVSQPKPPAVSSVDSSGFAAVDWLSTEDVAELAGVSAQYVRRAAGAGRLRGRRAGWGWEFRREDAEEFAAGRAGRGRRAVRS